MVAGTCQPAQCGRGGAFGNPEEAAQRWLRVRISLQRRAGVAFSTLLMGLSRGGCRSGCGYVSASNVWQGWQFWHSWPRGCVCAQAPQAKPEAQCFPNANQTGSHINSFALLRELCFLRHLSCSYDFLRSPRRDKQHFNLDFPSVFCLRGFEKRFPDVAFIGLQ